VRPRFLPACLLIAVAALALASSVTASAGLAGRDAQSDGTLSVKGGRGAFTLQGMQGSVLGRLDKGRLTIGDTHAVVGTVIVRGYDWIKPRVDGSIVYGGTNIRFRVPAGRFDLKIESAVGVELSVVGRGRAMLDGAGFDELGLSDGEYSLNGAPYVTVPSIRTWVSVKAQPHVPPPKRP
jgi:opacity protein-like surface antigen